jgi:CHASE2 domain-containing sensor protein/CheY-like chemotaxis protein/nitrogen-specific signal transduction histidine kinase
VWNQLKQYLWRGRSIALTATIVSGVVIGLRWSGALQALEWQALDQCFQQRPVEPPDPRIILVTIDEADITRLSQWTISDADLAKVLENIQQQQPRVIGLDLYRNLPVEPGHSDLLRVFQSTPNLIGIEKVAGSLQGAAIAPSPALAKLGQVSASDVVVDDDGTVRRALLSLRNLQGQTVLSLPVRLALLYLQAEGIQLEVLDRDRSHLRLGKAEFLPLQPHAGGYVQADVGGYQMLSNYRRLQPSFSRISLSEVMAGKIPANLMRDRIVLIGTVAASLGDRLNTPRPDLIDSLPGTPGVMLHADVTSQLLSAAIDGRPLLRSWAEPWEWGWMIGWAWLGAAIGWRVRSPQRTGIGILLISGTLVLATYWLFLQGWWVPLVPALLTLVGAAVSSQSSLLWTHLLSSKRQLEAYTQTLEQQVADRTQELSEKNRLLQQEIYNHQQTELALQQAKQAAETANDAKSQFLATISHELRTPLNSIIGFAQLLLEDLPPTAPEHEQLNIIYHSSLHLLDLINDVLTMSKIEVGQVALEPHAFDLHNLLNLLTQMLRQRSASKQVQLVCEMADDLPQVIITDEGKLRQVLLNLLGNAIKFTERGKVTLRVWQQGNGQRRPNPASANAKFPIADLLSFEIEDTGPGIAETELCKLFQPFEQTESGRRAQQGTGLGLAISQNFVHLMGGEITVSSQVGVGTTFRFAIPIQVGAINDPEKRSIQRNWKLASAQPEHRILVVEDKAENRQLLLHLLKTAGFLVQPAENGEMAVQLWESWHPHLILMDLHMPVMDGYKATEIIRSREHACHPETPIADRPAATKILALTAYALGEARTAALTAGCNDVLHKPFKAAELFQALAAHLAVRYVSPGEPLVESLVAPSAIE